MKLKSKYAWLLAAALLLSACSKDEKVAPVDDIDEAVAEVVVEEELNYSLPFTGEKVAEEPTQRPIIVTINNQIEARPQSGIGSADMIFEMLAEGEATRLLALYQSELPETLGPIRSARTYFIEVADGFDAFYVAHGYSPDAYKMLRANVIDNVNGMQYDGIYFNRAAHRKAPHNSYLSKENLEAVAAKLGISLEANDFVPYSFYENEENVKMGMDASLVNVRLSNAKDYISRYDYKTDGGFYERTQGSNITTDEITGEPIEISNLLFLEIPHRIVDNEGRRVLDLKVGGKAYVAQQGVIREVAWENRDGQLVTIENDGSDVLLVPGQTWVHFVPTKPGLTTAITFE